jgi:hypothetical protein
MITIPVSRPARAKAIVIGAGIASILISRFLPEHLSLFRDLLAVLGIGGFGVGAAQVVQAPQHGGP